MKPVVLINVFTVKPGKLNAFIELQTSAIQLFSHRISGWRGSRLHKGLGGNTAVMMTVFDTVEHHKAWIASEQFEQHRVKVLQLVEKVEPAYYEVAHEAGHLDF